MKFTLLKLRNRRRIIKDLQSAKGKKDKPHLAVEQATLTYK